MATPKYDSLKVLLNPLNLDLILKYVYGQEREIAPEVRKKWTDSELKQPNEELGVKLELQA